MARSRCAGLPKFTVGELVRLVTSRGSPPEGFRTTSAFEACAVEVPEGAVGVVVNPPSSSYSLHEQGDIMSWVLVDGHVLEVPHPHIRRMR